MVDSYAQAYHWSLDQIAQLTYPQIILLNHAAHFNRQVFDARTADRRRRGQPPTVADQVQDAPIFNGKRLNEMTTDEMLSYQGLDAPKVKVIKTKKKE